jgi:5-methylcytosine-specific restriction endonuclease McrA
VCGDEYTRTYAEQRTCGRACGVVLRRTVTATLPADVGRACKRCGIAAPHSHVAFAYCPECGKLFASRDRKTCGRRCARLRSNRQTSDYIMARYNSDPAFRDRMLAQAHLRRADMLGVTGNDEIRTRRDLVAYLTARDHNRCGICRKPIRAKKGPMRPSIDHIIPLARGGTHELANLQAAHYRCNLSKNDRGGGEQLLLVG